MTGTVRTAASRVLRLCARLARDCAGNTMMLVAAAIFPILAMIGGGVDMGRNYLAESRLQQACDAGVLAARKTLGSATTVDVATETKIRDAGARFFNINFADGAYGSADRRFAMVLNDDLTINGTATVTMPTTIMKVFGYDHTDIAVSCTGKLSVTNTDVMMALDVTGSMNEALPGDSQSKITALKSVVKAFYTQLESNRVAGSRVRYGFVPYSTNVRVGALLDDDWVVNSWTYQSRTIKGTLTSSGTYSYYTGASPVSGSYGTTTSTYAATLNAKTKKYSCPTKPANTLTHSTALDSTVSETVTSPLPGTRTTQTYNRTTKGSTYSVALSGTTCTVSALTYNDYVDRYSYVTEPALAAGNSWVYEPVTRDVSAWRSETNGCIEERGTYDITDYSDVDLSRALDLDIDTVPTAGDPATQWRPEYPAIVYDRALTWGGGGSWKSNAVTTSSEYIAPYLGGFAACPPAAQKLKEMTSSEVDTYVAGLSAAGSTYHDIGMIWGGRLLSPTGLFADENADIDGMPTSRNLIFLTDGQTAPLDLSYGAYGVEPLDKRRWDPATSGFTLTETVEKRFSFACEEVKKKNIKVWLIAFGTDLNPIMTECAGEGHYFRANNASELTDVFAKIARSIGELRLSQ